MQWWTHSRLPFEQWVTIWDILWTTYPKWSPIVQKVILNVFIIASKCVKKNQCFNFETNCSSIKQRFKKLGDGLLSKIGKNKHTFPIFDNDFLASSNQIKLKSTDYIYPIKKDDICDYNPLCFMSSGIMLDDIIMNIFTQSTKNSTEADQEHLFSRSKDDAIQLYKGSMQDFTYPVYR